MDIQVEKLRQALDLVSAAIPRGSPGKSGLPISSSVLFRNGKLTATNLEIWISVELPELGRSIPGWSILTMNPGRSDVVMEAASSRVSLVKPAQPRDFPPMPQLSDEDGFTVDGDRLVRGLLEMLHYVARQSSNLPVITGVALRLDTDLELAAANGFRLAVHDPGIELKGNRTGHLAIVPAASAQALGTLWQKGDKPPDIDAATAIRSIESRDYLMNMSVADLAVAQRNLRMVEDGNHISFSFGTISLCSVLIQREFPRYRDMIPDTTGGRQVSVRAEELLRVVNQIAVSAQAADIGDSEATIPAVVKGGDGEIAFNLGYLQQYLRAKTHVVTIATVAGEAEQVRGKPGVFTHRGTEAEQPLEARPDQDRGPTADGEPEDGEVVVPAEEESEQDTQPAEGESQATPPRRRRRRSPQEE